MRRALAVGLACAAGSAGFALLAAPLLPSAPAAARLAPHHAELQLRVARDAFRGASPGDRSESALFARRAIAAAPLNQPALALVAEADAASQGTDALNLGAALGWRDPLTNARLADLALAAGENTIAAQRIDAIGRTRGGEAASAPADRLMAQAGGPAALAARASNRTEGLWWIVYLQRPAGDNAALAGRTRFAASIAAADGPWRREIVTATLLGIAQSPVTQAEKDRLSSPLQAMLQ